MSDVDLFGQPYGPSDDTPGGKKPWFSPSRLSTFLQCPRKYEYQVVQKLPTAPAPHFDLGTNVHAALRDWLRLPPSARTWEGLLEFYRAAWRKNRPAFATRSRDELREWGERGKLMLQRFAEETPADLEPVALEKSVRVDFGDLIVGGRVDRVDALPDGTLKVIDYKTGKVPKDEARARDEDMASAIYARGASGAFVDLPVSEVEYLYLETMERRTLAVDPVWQAHKETVIVGLARAAMAAEVSGEFPAQPSRLCAWCDYRSRCKAGQAFLDAGRAPH